MGMCIDSDFSILPLYFQLCEKWVFISKFGVVSAIAVLRPAGRQTKVSENGHFQQYGIINIYTVNTPLSTFLFIKTSI